MAGRDLHAAVTSMAVYVALSVSLGLAGLLLRNDVAYAQERGLAVMANPLLLPFYVAVLNLSVLTALSSLATVAREREHGTLQTLFYGPVDEVSYLAGKFAAHALIFGVSSCALFIALIAWGWLANLHIDLSMLAALTLALACGGAIVAMGLLTSAALTARAGILLFVGAAAVFLGVQVGTVVVSDAAAAGAGAFSALHDSLVTLNRLIAVVSPFAYLDAGLDALAARAGHVYATWLLMAVGEAVVSLRLAVALLRRRGVLR